MTNRISCLDCGRCNKKGKPSVTRLSKYCDENYVRKLQTKKSLFSFFTGIKDKFFNKRYDEEYNKMNTKGFRPSWFWR